MLLICYHNITGYYHFDTVLYTVFFIPSIFKKISAKIAHSIDFIFLDGITLKLMISTDSDWAYGMHLLSVLQNALSRRENDLSWLSSIHLPLKSVESD